MAGHIFYLEVFTQHVPDLVAPKYPNIRDLFFSLENAIWLSHYTERKNSSNKDHIHILH